MAASLAVLTTACGSTTDKTSSPTATPPPSVTVSATSTVTTSTSAVPTTTAPKPTTTVAAEFAVRLPVKTSCPPDAESFLTCWKVAVPVDYAKPAGKTIELAVTVMRADSSKWTSPVVRMLGLGSIVDWNAAFLPIVGHDSIAVDQRGVGRSAPYGDCEGLSPYRADINTLQIDATLGALLKSCVQAATTADLPLASTLDDSVIAKDHSVVRRSLGIDTWGIYSTTFSAGVALQMIALEPTAISSLFTIGPLSIADPNRAANTQAAFTTFATDCAAAPKCSANGDLNAALMQFAKRLRPGITTKTPDPSPTTGDVVKLSEAAVLRGIEISMVNPSIAPVIPGLIAGGAAGGTAGADADELIAGFFVSSPGNTNAFDFATECQIHTASRDATSAVGPGKPFGAFSEQVICEATGPVPAAKMPPAVRSDIPVFVVVPPYNAQSMKEGRATVLQGFTKSTTVLVPGVSDVTAELSACLLSTRAAFFDNPSATIDTTCLSKPAVHTLT